MAEKPERIAAFWRSYRAVCVPATASEAQIEDTQVAFYAGALVLFQILTTEAGTANDRSRDHGLEFMQQLHDELMDFRKHRIIDPYLGQADEASQH